MSGTGILIPENSCWPVVTLRLQQGMSDYGECHSRLFLEHPRGCVEVLVRQVSSGGFRVFGVARCLPVSGTDRWEPDSERLAEAISLGEWAANQQQDFPEETGRAFGPSE